MLISNTQRYDSMISTVALIKYLVGYGGDSAITPVPNYLTTWR
jgi:hypothetical protein